MSKSLIQANTSMAFGQYNSAVKYFKAYMDEEPYLPLSKEVLNLWSEAYNKLSDDKRNCIRGLEAYIESLEDYGDRDCKSAITALLHENRNDLMAICTEVVNIINNNLLRNVEGIREKVSIYNMKGDYCRYIWEVNNNEETYRVATEAYQEAMSICQWNFEPTDPYLLQVASNFTAHLNNANETEKAIVILKMVIGDIKAEDLENYDFLKKSYVELILKYLNDSLVRFQIIFDQKLIEEHEVDNRFLLLENIEESLMDDLNTRRRG